MKTLTILFESPNVFYAVIDGVNVRIDNSEEIERKLYQTDNRINGPISFDAWKRIILQHGDIFQVEGFEYEVKIHCDQYHAHTKASCKVAILKLAKEEEPKEIPNKIAKDHTSEWLKKYGNTNKSEWNLALEAVIHNLKLRGFNEQDYNGKILFNEIEKLKK